MKRPATKAEIDDVIAEAGRKIDTAFERAFDQSIEMLHGRGATPAELDAAASRMVDEFVVTRRRALEEMHRGLTEDFGVWPCH